MTQLFLVKLFELLVSMIVFFLLTLSAWGIGDLIFALLDKDRKTISQYVRALLSLTLGLGAIGQVVFISGLIGDSYQPVYFWSCLLILSIFSAVRFKNTFSISSFKVSFRDVSAEELLIIVLVAISSIVWLYAALNFTKGSDVITNHYQHAKACIILKHFGHTKTLPWDTDVLSSYNPSLVHMLFLIGKLLSDDRSANLINWLTQILVIMYIYIIARDVFSIAAAFMAVAIYFGCSFLCTHPVDVFDYTAVAVFMLASLYCIYLYKNTMLEKYLICAGIFAGFMLSSKYYGIPLVASLCILFAYWGPLKFRDKVRSVFVYCFIALIIFSPWIIYHLKEYGNPIFPFMSKGDFAKYCKFLLYDEIMAVFAVPSDRGYFWPTVFYYISLFIPYKESFWFFGLTPIFLIGLPCSVYYWIRFRQKQWQDANILWIVSMIAYFGIEIAGRFAIWYKFGIFATVIYAISLSGIFTTWQRKAKQWMWAAILLVGLINTCFAFKYISRWVHVPPISTPKAYWDPVTQYINLNLEKNASVANQSITTNYYLRKDIHGLAGWGVSYSTDWHREEQLIHANNIEYYVFYGKEELSTISDRKHLFDFLIQVGEYDKAASVQSLLNLYLKRTSEQKYFLKKYGRIVQELPDEIIIYKLLL
ncbi:MAG: glycosyltransferase family 39 protein [Nitrospirae bacterium]|nr:glycosyltransferase family 39 protein [Nitrospirota bacterium]MBF0553584.1 glycosyltransferase family 39 protein [Nitrospirota bacterium]